MANTKQTTYNVNKTAFTVGNHRIRGYADGTGIEIEQNEDRVSLKVGCMGDYVASVNNDESATITLHLLQNSVSLDILEEYHQLGVSFPASLVDMNDGITKSGQDAWVSNMGGYSRGVETETIDVTILVGKWN